MTDRDLPTGPGTDPNPPRQADAEARLVRRLSLPSLLPLVAIGGGVGALARWGVQHLTIDLGGAIPAALLVVNLAGSLLLGMLFTRLDSRYPSLIDIDLPPGYEPGRHPVHPILAAAVVGGSLGAFTTYSALCFEVIRLWNSGSPWSAAILLVASLALGPAAIAIGVRIGHRSHPAVRGR
ncbi:MAG: hypothetical protein CMJ52_07990 [Planctomycetaceae bacterium]|nr:hypothetical protein [Planctomycetaceae bacterium]